MANRTARNESETEAKMATAKAFEIGCVVGRSIEQTKAMLREVARDVGILPGEINSLFLERLNASFNIGQTNGNGRGRLALPPVPAPAPDSGLDPAMEETDAEVISLDVPQRTPGRGKGRGGSRTAGVELSPATKDAIRHALKRGASVNSVASKYGISWLRARSFQS